jgi:hypothetical protein
MLGIAAAVAASSLYSLGIALQALEAKQAPEDEHLRLALIWRLIQRGRWLLGTGLSALGWPFQVLALTLAPLVVVQPTLATGLLVLMLFAERILHERAGRREHLAMVAIILGVAGVALCAPERSTAHATDLVLVLVLVGLGLASTLPYLLRLLGRQFASVTMLGAGLAFAWSGVTTKLVADELERGNLLVAGAWGLSTLGASALGTLSEMSALQSRPAIQVAPFVFVTQTAVPVALAPLLLGESFASTPLGGVPLIASLLVLIAGAASLVRSPLLLGLMEGHPSEESVPAPSPSERSQETNRSTAPTDAEDPSTLTTKTSPARAGR